MDVPYHHHVKCFVDSLADLDAVGESVQGGYSLIMYSLLHLPFKTILLCWEQDWMSARLLALAISTVKCGRSSWRLFQRLLLGVY